MIVFCHLLNDNSGSPLVLREAIRALTSGGQEGVLFVGSQGRGSLEAAGVPIQRYWYCRSRFRLVTLFTYAASQLFLYRALSSAKLPDDTVLYVNTLLPFGAALWAYRHQYPIVYHAHEISISPDPLRRFLVYMAEKTAQQVIYVSHDHRKRLPIKGVPAKVVPNPVASETAELGSAASYRPRRTGHFEVLMLASPRDYKGVPEFLDLARRLAAYEDVRFTLVLNASAEEIANYLPEGNRPENVNIHPRTNAPSQFYATADVLLNLSRVDLWIETFGLTIVEGMAFGLPVIAPPVGGPAELVEDGVQGFLIDSRNIDLLKERVLLLLNDQSLCMRMSAECRKRAADFAPEHFAESIRQVIAEGC